MVFDADVKLGRSYKGTSFLAEDYLQVMEAMEIDRAMLLAEKPLSYRMAEGNDYIESVAAQHPGRFYAAVRIDPWQGKEEARAELRLRLQNPAVRAVYLNPWEENCPINSPTVHPVLECAAEYGVGVIVEAGYPWVSHVSQIADAAKEYPTVRFLMTNAGQLDLSGYTLTDVKYFMGRVPNLYLGTAAAVAAEWLAEMERTVAPGRVLFETNYPAFEPRLERQRIELGYFTPQERQRIFCDNAEAFYARQEAACDENCH